MTHKRKLTAANSLACSFWWLFSLYNGENMMCSWPKLIDRCSGVIIKSAGGAAGGLIRSISG